MTPDEQIVAAFPADLPEHRQARLALLRALHAAEQAEDAIDAVAYWIGYMIDDPPEGTFNLILAENCQAAAVRLELAASQLRRSVAQFQALKPSWQLFQTEEVREDVSR